METLNTPWLALIALVGFVWLSWTAMHRHEEASYSHSVFAALDRLPDKQAAGLNNVWESLPTVSLSTKLPEDWK